MLRGADAIQGTVLGEGLGRLGDQGIAILGMGRRAADAHAAADAVAEGDEAADVKRLAHGLETVARLGLDEAGGQRGGLGSERPKPRRS